MYSSPGRFVHLPLAYDHSALWVSLFYAQELVFPFPAASPPASRLPLSRLYMPKVLLGFSK